MTKKLTFFLLWCFCFLVFMPGITSAQTTFQITEAELVQLETNLSRQEAIISQLLSEAKLLKLSESESKVQLQAALNELQQMKSELALLRTDLANSDASLKRANQSLQVYEREMKSKVRTVKLQRNIWFAGFLGTGIYALTK